MQSAKVLSSSYQKNRTGKFVLTCVAEIRKGQNVNAEYIQPLGESSRPANGDWILLIQKGQSIGKFYALGFVDIINAVAKGVAKTKITLNEFDVVIESAETASITVSEDDVFLNNGDGTALEADRLQNVLDQFSASILAEFQQIAIKTEPKNPSDPYIAPPDLPVDVSPAKSESVRLP